MVNFDVFGALALFFFWFISVVKLTNKIQNCNIALQNTVRISTLLTQVIGRQLWVWADHEQTRSEFFNWSLKKWSFLQTMGRFLSNILNFFIQNKLVKKKQLSQQVSAGLRVTKSMGRKKTDFRKFQRIHNIQLVFWQKVAEEHFDRKCHSTMLDQKTFHQLLQNILVIPGWL